MASRREKHLLRAKAKAENFWLFAFLSCYFFICCFAVAWLTFGNYWGNSLTHLMLIITFGQSSFGPKVTLRGWVSTPNWVPKGLWSQWRNPLNYSLQIAENTLPRLTTSFSKNVEIPPVPKANVAWYCSGFRLA